MSSGESRKSLRLSSAQLERNVILRANYVLTMKRTQSDEVVPDHRLGGAGGELFGLRGPHTVADMVGRFGRRSGGRG